MQQRPTPMQPQQPMQPQEIPFSDVRYGTLDEAKAYIVMPGKSAMFINRNLGEFYVKSANNMGEPLLETFKYSTLDTVETTPTPTIDTSNFVKPEDYGYDMARGRGANRGGGRGRGDRGDYDYDYGYDYGGDYGEKLTREEMEHWRKKLDKEVGDEQSKNFFKKENIEQRAKQLGIEMKEFDAEELALASYMLYSDYCDALKPYLGSNMDAYIKLGYAFLRDKDSAVKGGEKLALYFDIVSGEDD